MSDHRQRALSSHHGDRYCRDQGEHHQKRSRSPVHHHRHHHSSHKRSRRDDKAESDHDRRETASFKHTPTALPLNAAPISKHDRSHYRPLFALYLDIQKQLDIKELPEDEARGRWKSFVKKWNAGDLAEGWYDSTTMEKAQRGTFGLRESEVSTRTTSASAAAEMRSCGETYSNPVSRGPDRRNGKDRDDEADDSDFGPSPPATQSKAQPRQDPRVMDSGDDDDDDDDADDNNDGHGATVGPSIPSTSDLRAHHEQQREEAEAARSRFVRDRQIERTTERKLQRDRLEELAPRAEPGSRERRLEKKRDTAASNRAFAAAKNGDGSAGDVELRDSEVMGEEDSLGELRRMKEIERRRKTEREVRREEILRARMAEREERMRGLREKEAKTMEMLKSIARARFGGESGEGAE